MITIDLSGKAAVVTGGSAGIGRAITHTLLRAGAHVTVLARDAYRDEADDLYSGSCIDFVELDITDSRRVSAVYADLARQRGIDIAVHSAGTLAGGALAETSDEQWRNLMAVNLDGAFFCSREAIRHMLDSGNGGKVVLIGSVSGLVGNPGFAAYCASKAALINLTRQAAVDYAALGINVNSVLPGFVTTRMTERYDERTKEYLAAQTPTGTWAAPQDIADAVLFLCSALSDHVHGHNLVVDGGLTAGTPLNL
ncbi:MAG: SDR family NAD(P)-dependent oxidoreductase [Sphingomonadaceae bacterium]